VEYSYFPARTRIKAGARKDAIDMLGKIVKIYQGKD
jgi:hypothetical protein